MVDSPETEAELRPAGLHAMNERFRARDSSAFDELIRRTHVRFERLARRMPRDYPPAQAREQTHDAVQGSLVRLTRALREATSPTDRDFLGLAFYPGCAQPEITGLLHIGERQVRRLWAGACLRVYRSVGGNMPHRENALRVFPRPSFTGTTPAGAHG